jgi:hypothetical protein
LVTLCRQNSLSSTLLNSKMRKNYVKGRERESREIEWRVKWEAIVGDYKPVKVVKWRLIGVSLLPSGYCNTKTVTVVAFYWSAILMTTKPFHLLSFSQLSVSLVLNQKWSEFSFKLFVFISCLLYFLLFWRNYWIFFLKVHFYSSYLGHLFYDKDLCP